MLCADSSPLRCLKATRKVLAGRRGRVCVRGRRALGHGSRWRIHEIGTQNVRTKCVNTKCAKRMSSAPGLASWSSNAPAELLSACEDADAKVLGGMRGSQGRLPTDGVACLWKKCRRVSGIVFYRGILGTRGTAAASGATACGAQESRRALGSDEQVNLMRMSTTGGRVRCDTWQTTTTPSSLDPPRYLAGRRRRCAVDPQLSPCSWTPASSNHAPSIPRPSSAWRFQ